MNRDRQLHLGDGVRVEVIDAELASPLDYAKAIGKQRTLDDCEDAFLVGDLSAIASQLRRWRSRLPRVEPFYAVKCNDDPAVLRTLALLGTGFDCASKTELRRVLQLGVPPERIIYANPCKQVSMIRFARDSQVPLMTFDNLDELQKIKENYPEAKMVLRILPQAVKAQCVLGNKFGAPYEAVAKLIRTAKSLAVDVVGVSFHVGSGCQDAQGYAYALQLARRVFDDLIAAEFQPYLLDVGGGFPGTDEDVLSFEEIADVLMPTLDELFPVSSGVQVIAEPGRFMVTRAFTLMANVIAKRTPSGTQATSSTGASHAGASSSDSETEVSTSSAASTPSTECKSPAAQRFYYYLNDGVYGSFNCLFFDHCSLRACLAKRVPDGTARFASSLYGPTCDGLDCIMQEVQLPELAVGDWLYFENMGAYTLVSASEFNGMPRAARFYVLNKTDVALFHRELAATVTENGGAISGELAALVGESLLAEVCSTGTLPDVDVAEHQLDLPQPPFAVADVSSGLRDELKTVLREFREQAVQRSEGDLADTSSDAAAIAQLETLLNAMGVAETSSNSAFGDESSCAEHADNSLERVESTPCKNGETDESLTTCSEAAHRESVSASNVSDSDMLADESSMPAVTLIFD